MSKISIGREITLTVKQWMKEKRGKKITERSIFCYIYCWHWRPWHCPCSESFCCSSLYNEHCWMECSMGFVFHITSNINVKTFNHHSNKWMKGTKKIRSKPHIEPENVNNVIEQKIPTEFWCFWMKHFGFILLKVINFQSVCIFQCVNVCARNSFDNVDGYWKSCVENRVRPCAMYNRIVQYLDVILYLYIYQQKRLELKALSHWSHHIQI